MRDDAGTALGNRLRHVPVIVIGPRKPSADLTVGRSLPVFPDKRAISEPVGMSQKCQEQNRCLCCPTGLYVLTHPREQLLHVGYSPTLILC